MVSRDYHMFDPILRPVWFYDDNINTIPLHDILVATTWNVWCADMIVYPLQSKDFVTVQHNLSKMHIVFFDFDGTLTLKNGLLKRNTACISDKYLSTLFGSDARQQAIVKTIQMNGVYIITANPYIDVIAHVLNVLLSKHSVHPCFSSTTNVMYHPLPTKLPSIVRHAQKTLFTSNKYS